MPSLSILATAEGNWAQSPALALILLIWMAVYFLRFSKARREPGSGVGPVRAIAFTGAMLLFAAALLSPIDSLSERLFTMHMVQHILLADLAPLLLLLGLSRVILRPLTRRLDWLERALGPLASPITALAVWLGTLFLWHLPVLYDAALRSPALHALEHATFIVAGIAFWWPLIQPVPMRRRLGSMGALGYLTGAKLGLGLLGLYLAWSPAVIYSFYKHAPTTWGLTTKTDQTIGAAIMLVEQALVIAVAFAIFFSRMLDRSERDELHRERAATRQYGADYQ